jgi:hypothetical protein
VNRGVSYFPAEVPVYVSQVCIIAPDFPQPGTGEKTMENRDSSALSKNLLSAEKKLTKELIKWKLKRDGLPAPDEETMDKGAERIVDEAHKIMKRRAKSILEELKQTKQAFVKAYRDEEEKEKE